MSDAYSRPTGYQSGPDAPTQYEVARRQVERLIEQLRAGEIDEEFGYGMERYRAEEYTLSGGGPGSDVTFIMDGEGDVRAAFFSYYEGSGPVAISLASFDAQALYEALNSPPKDEEDDDDEGEDEDDDVTYKIVRFYADSSVDREVVTTGLTLEEAQEHCSDPDTASQTCTTPEGTERTRRHGAWFEGYEIE